MPRCFGLIHPEQQTWTMRLGAPELLCQQQLGCYGLPPAPLMLQGGFKCLKVRFLWESWPYPFNTCSCSLCHISLYV